MRSGISITVSPGDRDRLESIVSDPKSSQKHVWRAKIILLTDDGLGTSAIMSGSGKSKTCVWRWQERFMREGVDGLLRDASRLPGKVLADIGDRPLLHYMVDRVRRARKLDSIWVAIRKRSGETGVNCFRGYSE